MLMPLIFGLLCWLFALAVLAFGIAWLFSTGALDLLFAGKQYRAFVLSQCYLEKNKGNESKIFISLRIFRQVGFYI